MHSEYRNKLHHSGHYDPTLLAAIGNWLLAGAIVIDLVLFFSLTRRGPRLVLRSLRIWTAVVVFLPAVLLQVLPDSTPRALQQVLFALMSLRILYLFCVLNFIAERKFSRSNVVL